MVFAELIVPKSAASWQERGYVPEGDRIACESCELSYSFQNYKILYAGKKLAYFIWVNPDSQKAPLVCHECLFKHVRKVADGESITLVIYDEEKEHICKFHPETGNMDYPIDDGNDQSDWEDPDYPPFLPE